MLKHSSSKNPFSNQAYIPNSEENIPGCSQVSNSPIGDSSLKEILSVPDKMVMRREIGFLTSIGFIVGSIIGSGIFVSPSGVVKYCGSVGLSLIVWSVSGLLGLMAALCYLELSLLIPTSGAEYSYLLSAFGPFHNILGPIPAFLYAWTYTIIITPGANAVKVLAFSDYVIRPFFHPCPAPYIAKRLLSAVAICIIAFGNSATLKFSKSVQNILTSIKVLGLLVILVAGIVQLCMGKLDILKTGFDNTEKNGLTVAKAFYNSFWAYTGWNTLSATTEEMTNPEKIFPKAIWSGMIIVIFIYVGVNIAYFTVLTPEQIVDSDAVAESFGYYALGVFTYAIPFIVAASVLGSFNAGIYSVGRVGAVAARDGNFPEFLSYIHYERRTPIISTVLSAILSFILIGPNSISELINLLGFVMWIFNGLTMLALLVMRYTRRDTPRRYAVPLLFPIIIFLLSIYLVFSPIIEKPDIKYLYIFIGIIGGLLFYFPLKLLKVDCTSSKFYNIIQKFFLVLPMEYSKASDISSSQTNGAMVNLDNKTR